MIDEVLQFNKQFVDAHGHKPFVTDSLQVRLRSVAGPQKSADLRRKNAQEADYRRRLAKK